MSPSWPTIRAALLLAVILAHGVVAIPSGPRVTAASLRTEAAQREVEVWMRLAGPLGFSREGFEATVITASDRWVSANEVVSKPIRAVLRVFRQGQSWGLFAATDRDPLRLEVRGRTADGTERLLYRRLSREHTFLRPWLDFRRVRGVFDLSSKTLPPRYKNFGRWVAARAFEAHPDLVEVTVTQVEFQVRLPHEPPDPSTREKYTMVLQRDDLTLGATP